MEFKVFITIKNIIYFVIILLYHKYLRGHLPVLDICTIFLKFAFFSPQSKIHAIEAKLQKMQEEKSSNPEVKPVPGSSELSVVQREARLREMELASARRQTKRPYKR